MVFLCLVLIANQKFIEPLPIIRVYCFLNFTHLSSLATKHNMGPHLIRLLTSYSLIEKYMMIQCIKCCNSVLVLTFFPLLITAP